MNPQACDGNMHDDEQQQHLLHDAPVSDKESSSVTFTTATTTTNTAIASAVAAHHPAPLYPRHPDKNSIFRIGLVLYDLKGVSKTDIMSIRAISNPASSCQLVAMSIIESLPLPSSSTDTTTHDSSGNEKEVRQWLSQNIPTSYYEYCIPKVNNNHSNTNTNTTMHNNNSKINSMSLNHENTTTTTTTLTATHHDVAPATASSSRTFSRPPTAAAATTTSISTMPLYFGIDGYHKMLQENEPDDDDDKNKKNSTMDAVYIIVPTDKHQHDHVLQALHSNQHVLLNDPRSTSYETFLEQVEAARGKHRFIQFSTMFVHHYRVSRFLDCVSYQSFGSSSSSSNHPTHHHHSPTHADHYDDGIESMYALLTINVNDVDKLGGPKTTFPIIKPGDGCLRRLARYCVLIALLLMQQAPPPLKNNKSNKTIGDDDNDDDDCQVILPISVQCTKATSSTSSSSLDNGQIKKEPIQASGIVKFAHGRTLTFDVAYSNAPTRQVLKVEGRHRYATMTDFVIPHPDGLSTYRLYDKKKTTKVHVATAAADATKTDHDKTGTTHASSRPWRHADLEIVKGQALDVPSGPPQDVMMWRRFASACRSVQQSKEGSGSAASASASASAAGGEAAGGGDDGNDANVANGRQAARNFTKVAMHLKRILKALDESYCNDFIEIALDDITK